MDQMAGWWVLLGNTWRDRTQENWLYIEEIDCLEEFSKQHVQLMVEIFEVASIARGALSNLKPNYAMKEK